MSGGLVIPLVTELTSIVSIPTQNVLYGVFEFWEWGKRFRREGRWGGGGAGYRKDKDPLPVPVWVLRITRGPLSHRTSQCFLGEYVPGLSI